MVLKTFWERGAALQLAEQLAESRLDEQALAALPDIEILGRRVPITDEIRHWAVKITNERSTKGYAEPFEVDVNNLNR